MSAQIFQFRQAPVKGEAPKPTPGVCYQCTTCKQDHFLANLEGELWCATCVRVIANLQVVCVR